MTTKKKKKDTTTIGIDNLLDVVTTWLHHLVSHAVDNPQQTETTINNYISNQRREEVDDDDIYSGIEEMLPLFGNPIDWFRDVYLTTSDTAKTAMKTAKKQRKAAVAAAADADKEFHNKKRCLEAETEKRQYQANISSLTTPTAKGAGSVLPTTYFGSIGVGVFVKVKQDLSPGKCSHGGSGFVTNVTGNGPSSIFTVKYNDPSGGTTESNIGYARLTILPVFIVSNTGSRQPKRSTTTIENKTTTTNNTVTDNRTIIELLTYAKSVGRKKG